MYSYSFNPKKPQLTHSSHSPSISGLLSHPTATWPALFFLSFSATFSFPSPHAFMSQKPVSFVNFAWPVYNTVRRKDALLDELVHSCLVGITRLHIHYLCCHQNHVLHQWNTFYIFQKIFFSCLVSTGCSIFEPLFRLNNLPSKHSTWWSMRSMGNWYQVHPFPLTVADICVARNCWGIWCVMSLGNVPPFFTAHCFQMWPKSMTVHLHLK